MASLYRTKIQALKGVGERRAELFRKLGVTSVGALLRLYPRAYEDLSHPCGVRGASPGLPCAVRARVLNSPAATRARGGMTLYRAQADDGRDVFTLTFFNNPYIPRLLRAGESYVFYGRVTANFLGYGMAAPEFFPADSCPPIRPVYPQTQGLSSRVIASAVREALGLLPETVRDPLPPELLERYSLCGLRCALENIHFPASMKAAERARGRLIFEELLVLSLGLSLLRRKNGETSGFPLKRDCSGEFLSLLPFRPTRAQARAIREGIGDMMSGRRMARLVQGDVGSGKTAVAAALCHSAVKNGLQAALMAPTEILARQHAESLKKLLEPAGVTVALLTGSVPPARKRAVLAALEQGKIGLLVGTHALLSKKVKFRRLGLVVTDEQHRFGVAQRAALSAKGDRPHMLVMSATPIPRTLALMIYGDLDLSVLDELPPGRRKVLTYSIPSGKRPRAFAFLREKLAQGQQGYIVCPAIGEGQSDLAGVTEYTRKLRTRWLPGCSVAALHGRMKPKEKNAVMEAFAAGKIGVLVSTTVVEVGIDVPNATVMLIENAERYGLSQLHQLRGRVGRGPHQSYCILISDAQNKEALARLDIMRRTSDGFRIADEDLKLRGPGDFFGSRQHGLPALKIADMTADMGTLSRAREAAARILKDDPDLSQPAYRRLRAEVRQLFAHTEIS